MGSGLEESYFFMPIRRDLHLSDGELHATSSWDWLEVQELYRRFEAWTHAPGLYRGVYKDPDTGARVPDESRKYILMLRRDQVDELRTVLVQACSVFHQKCILLVVNGEAEFVQVDRTLL